MRRLLPLLAVAILLSCNRSKNAKEIQTVRLAIHREPIYFLPVSAAESLGYFRQAGLAVQTSEVAGGSKAIEALLGGSVDVAAGSLSDAMQLVVQGHGVRYFLLLYSRPTVAVAISPGWNGKIRSVQDLKGHTVGVSSPGSASHQFLNFLLRSNGLSGKDVSAVSVGMSSTSVAALEHSKVDAAVLIGSAIDNFANRHPDSTFLVDTRTTAGARQFLGSEVFPSLGLLAEEAWLTDQSNVAKRLVRALKKAMQWIKEHPAEEVRQMLPPGVKTSNAEIEIRAIRQIQGTLSSDGLAPNGSVERVRKFLELTNPNAKSAPIDVAKAYTAAFASQN